LRPGQSTLIPENSYRKPHEAKSNLQQIQLFADRIELGSNSNCLFVSGSIVFVLFVWMSVWFLFKF